MAASVAELPRDNSTDETSRWYLNSCADRYVVLDCSRFTSYKASPPSLRGGTPLLVVDALSSVVAGSVRRRSFHAGRINRDQTFDTAEEKEETEVNNKRSIRLLTKLLPPQDLSARRFETSEESVERRKPVQRSEGSKGKRERNKEKKRRERKSELSVQLLGVILAHPVRNRLRGQPHVLVR
jgi:hypothetical protein